MSHGLVCNLLYRCIWNTGLKFKISYACSLIVDFTLTCLCGKDMISYRISCENFHPLSGGRCLSLGKTCSLAMKDKVATRSICLMTQDDVFSHKSLSCCIRPYMSISHLLSGLPGTDPCGDRTDDSSVAEKTTRSNAKALQNNCWFYDRHEKLLVLT